MLKLKNSAIVLLALPLLSGCAMSGGDPATNGANLREASATYGPADGAIEGNAFERGSPLYVNASVPANYHGQIASDQEPADQVVVENNAGLVLKNSKGGVVILPTETAPAPDADLVNARELKLKMRELAAQLVGGLDKSFAGQVALPTAFVNQDDFERSSSLGRFIVEQMFYEFNLRGVPTREYRMNGKLTMREDGEFILRREPGQSALDPKALYLVGTYYNDQNTVFVNARLIKADGRVVRAGQLVLGASPMTRRMAANSGKRISGGVAGLEIRDFYEEARVPEASTPIDQGMDIH
ncbi:MAG: hypothetical protein LBV80_04370 [Deltaproteobacteria bacterium]|jgi:hypothetical protein|nr:hypothetical protein [Deltaproteobacteria bacterium]